MEFRIFMMLVSIACYLSICVLIGVKINETKQSSVDLNGMINGSIALSSANIQKSFQEKIKESSWYQKKIQKLTEQLAHLRDKETNPEDIVRFEFLVLASGLGVTLFVHLIFRFMILTILSLILTIYFTAMKEMTMRSKIKAKLEEFDEQLPQFESGMLLSMQAGAGIQKAMKTAIKSMPDSLAKAEFEQLMVEIGTSTSNISTPYLNLSRRVPTKDCERFCNVVLFGLKSGNSMSDILENESQYMNQQIINRLQERGEKNSVKATAITSGLVFMPMIILFIAPLMANSM